jgi:hypothetical protein
MDISIAISNNDIEQFKKLLNSPKENYQSLSEDKRYAFAYSQCISSENKSFLHCLIFELNLAENLIASQYITDEVKVLFAQRKAQELSDELSVNDNKESKPKI